MGQAFLHNCAVDARVIGSALAPEVRGLLITNTFIDHTLGEHWIAFLGRRAKDKTAEFEIIPVIENLREYGSIEPKRCELTKAWSDSTWSPSIG